MAANCWLTPARGCTIRGMEGGVGLEDKPITNVLICIIMKKKSLLDELRDRGTIFQDPCPPQPSPIKTIIKIIGDILKKK